MGGGRAVVVLGGGIGGLVAARTLRRRAPSDVGVVLVDREETFTFVPSLLWLVSGERTPGRISRSRGRLTRAGIELLVGVAEDLDPEGRRVRVDGRELPYDRLVLALGAQPEPGRVPGLSAGGIDLYSVEGALEAGRALRSIEGGRVAIVVAGLPYKCPAAPNEAALLAAALLRRRRVRARITLYTPEPYPMPTAGEAVGRALIELLERRGIEVQTGRSLEAVDDRARELVFQDGERAGYDVLLSVAPHGTAPLVRRSGLANEAGFVPVDPATLAASAAGVYAVGDVTQISIAGGRFLPKAGVFAASQARVVARRIAAELGEREPTATFDGRGSCFLEVGDGAAAFATGAFYEDGAPRVRLRRPSRRWHLAKVAFERWWLARFP